MGRIILGAFLLLAAPIAFANSLTGKVVKITDGDTLYVLDANYEQHKIRLAEIDAPERKQAYGLASRKHLLSIVAGKQVMIEYKKRDRYGRILGKVWVNGVDVCLEQVKAGFACDLCLSHGQWFSHSGRGLLENKNINARTDSALH